MSAKYGFILLAAGSSSRFGRPKGLLPFEGTTLLEHTIYEMQALLYYPIVAVTGAHAEELAASLEDSGVTLAHNAQWREGMASSIRCGAESLVQADILEGIIIASCDQPAIHADIFRALIEKKESGNCHIIASYYAGASGIPVLFGRKYFSELMALSGEQGAKPLLQLHAYDVATIPFHGGEVDIDTQADYDALNAGGLPAKPDGT